MSKLVLKVKFHLIGKGFFIKEILIVPMVVGSIFKELPSCKYIGCYSVGFVKGDFIMLYYSFLPTFCSSVLL